MTQTASLPPADRLALIIEGLCHAVAHHGSIRGIAGPFLVLIWSRLRRTAARFARHATTLAPIPPSAAAERPARRSRRSQPRPLPRRKAWLLRLVPETASGASQLRHFLADPEVSRLLDDAPHLNRILRPLCGMLGVRRPGIRPTQASPPVPPPEAAPFHPAAPRVPPWPGAPQAAVALSPSVFPSRATNVRA